MGTLAHCADTELEGISEGAPDSVSGIDDEVRTAWIGMADATPVVGISLRLREA